MNNRRKIYQSVLLIIFLLFIGFTIYTIWKSIGIPFTPPREFLGKLPKHGIWAKFFSIWIPLLYGIFSLFYRWQTLYSQKHKNLAKKFLRYDTYTYFFIPTFLILELSWTALGNWFLWFSVFFISVFAIKSALSIRYVFLVFLAITRNSETEIHPVDTKLKYLLFTAALIVYIPISAWFSNIVYTTSIEPYYLLITHSIVYDHDLDLTNNMHEKDYRDFYWLGKLPLQNMCWTKDGKVQSKDYTGLYSFILAPGYLLAGRLGAVATNSILASLAMLLAFLLSLEFTKSYRVSFYSWLFITFTLPFLLYTTHLCADILASLIALFAFMKVIKLKESYLKNLFWILLCAVTLPLIRARFTPLSLSLLILVILYSKNWKLSLGIIIISVIGLAVILSNYQVLAQKITLFNRFSDLGRVWNTLLKGLKSAPYRLWGLFLDQEFGILFYSPIYLLIIPGLLLSIRYKWKKL